MGDNGLSGALAEMAVGLEQQVRQTEAMDGVGAFACDAHARAVPDAPALL